MATPTLTRRTVLNAAALATTALAAPFVHGAYAAGKLSCGFWDHWVFLAGLLVVQLGGLSNATGIMTCFALLSLLAVMLGRETRGEQLPR